MASNCNQRTFNWSASNLPDEFETFKQYCTLVFDGAFVDKLEKKCVSYLLLWTGHPGVNSYCGFVWESSDDKLKLTGARVGKFLKASSTEGHLAKSELQQF